MIGDWVQRFRNATPLTKAHLVESLIADRKVTRCGRQMGHIDGTALSVVESSINERCSVCDRGR